jgi:hypothetical protein
MNNIKNENQFSNWQTIHKKVSYFKHVPKPIPFMKTLLFSPSDIGELEYDGKVLRFMGNKKKISITSIEKVSIIESKFNIIHFIFLWFIYSILYILLLTIIFIKLTPIGSIIFGLVTTIAFWLYHRKYGIWVQISYRPSGKGVKNVYFKPNPFGGGGERLYNDLISLIEH